MRMPIFHAKLEKSVQSVLSRVLWTNNLGMVLSCARDGRQVVWEW